MQILHGVAFLHHNMIIHRDIKGDNVCMSGFVARIIDFGMARSLIIDDPKADGGEMLKHHRDNREDEKEVDDEEDGACQLCPAQRSAVLGPRSAAIVRPLRLEGRRMGAWLPAVGAALLLRQSSASKKQRTFVQIP